jgi:hypothetical protein
VLEHHADVLAHLVEVDLRVREVEVVDDHGSAGDVLQFVETAQERRLARARRPDDAHDLAVFDRGVDAVEDDEFPERLLQTLDADLDPVLRFGGRGLRYQLAHFTILFSTWSESLVNAMMTMK